MLEGVNVVVDPFSVPYLQGATIDFLTGLQESGFKIDNPNAASSCGCGHSFQVEEGAEGESARALTPAAAAPAALTSGLSLTTREWGCCPAGVCFRALRLVGSRVSFADREVSEMTAVYKFWAAIVSLGVVVQVGLAGYGSFYVAHTIDNNEPKAITEKGFEHGFNPHAGLGYLVVLAGIILLVIAAIGRQGGRRLKRTGLLAGLLVLQVILAWVGFGVPALGFLHPVNALLIVGLSLMITVDAWGWRHGEPAAA